MCPREEGMPGQETLKPCRLQRISLAREGLPDHQDYPGGGGGKGGGEGGGGRGGEGGEGGGRGEGGEHRSRDSGEY